MKMIVNRIFVTAKSIYYIHDDRFYGNDTSFGGPVWLTFISGTCKHSQYRRMITNMNDLRKSYAVAVF